MSDTVAALTKALAPKVGMQRIPFPLESYQHASVPLADKRLLNFYAEAEPADSRTAAALMPTPGLTASATYGSGPIQAMNSDEPGIVYIASGTEFFRVASGISGVVTTDLGAIGTPATDVLPATDLMVTIAVGPTACVVVVPPNAYTCSHSGALNQITGSFPGASTVAYLDGYFVFTSYANSSQFFISGLLDPTHYSALDFAFSDGLTNVIRRVIAHRGEIWLMGEAGTEIWYDNGVAGTGAALDFPFLRRSGGIIPYGVATPKSIARGDNSVFWVGYDGMVYRSIGYAPERISTHAIEAIVQAGDPTLVVSALTHSQNGHIFYCFTQGSQTFAYDCATKLWHNRSSSTDGSQRWLPNACATAGRAALFGDYVSGTVYYPDPASGLENGVLVQRQAVLPPIWGGTHRAFMNRLEVEMEVGGSGPGNTLLLEWSNDGGWTWTGSRPLDAGAPGLRRKRVVATRLGSFHQRVLRLTLVGHTTLYAVDADITAPLAGG